jgi:hypothetical protein
MSTSVYFFGGYNSSQKDIDAWLGSAKQQASTVGFFGFPWPGGTPIDPEKAIVEGSKNSGQFKFAVDTIQECSADKIYIIGHSSGCAIANEVDRGFKDNSKIVLVALDGFTPDANQRARSSTQVWAAKSGEGKAVHKSLHYDYLQNVVGGSLQVYEARTDCTTKLALHFSLVNAAATDKDVDTIPTGYVNCKANLAWL